jgi:hypothetical protein
MGISDNAGRDFWRWFQDHQSEFDRLSEPEEPFWDIALGELKRVDERLWFELSETGVPVREFVVTAEGRVEAFPIAVALVSHAPEVEGWTFVALKPPMGFDFTTRYEGMLFDAGQMWFLPLESASRPDDFGIRVGIQGLESMDAAVAQRAVLVILDTALGERSAALEIHHVEVVELPADPQSLGYFELPELPAYLSWRKKTQSVGSSQE